MHLAPVEAPSAATRHDKYMLDLWLCLDWAGGRAVVMDAHNQEAVDKDMWVALEDLTTQNRGLLSENASLKQQLGRSDRRPGCVPVSAKHQAWARRLYLVPIMIILVIVMPSSAGKA